MATNRHRYTVSVDDEMFQQIEDYRYKNRIPDRAKATAELLRLGLERFKDTHASNDENDE